MGCRSSRPVHVNITHANVPKADGNNVKVKWPIPNDDDEILIARQMELLTKAANEHESDWKRLSISFQVRDAIVKSNSSVPDRATDKPQKQLLAPALILSVPGATTEQMQEQILQQLPDSLFLYIPRNRVVIVSEVDIVPL